GNHCANLLIQNREAILSHMERWKDSLYQLAYEEKISPFIPKNLEKSLLRLFEPLPEAVAKEIEGQKSIIHKNREIPLALLKIIADYYGNQQDFNRAISYATTFLKLLIQKLPKISHKEGVLVKSIQIHTNLASWNQLLRQYPTAIYHSKKALEIAQELCNPYAIIVSLKGIGLIYAVQEQGKLALPFFQKAQVIAQTLQDSENKSQILNGLAHAYLIINNNTEAISCFQTALNLTDKKFKQAWIYSGIGRAHAEAQCYQLAKEAYHKALELLAPDDFFLAIKIHKSLAILFNHFGQYGKAISQLEKVLELMQHPSIQVNELEAFVSKFSALTILGSIYGAFGDYGREIDYQMQALETAEKITPFKNYQEAAFINLGNAYCNKRDYPKSIECYTKALKITKNVNARATVLINMANLYCENHMFAKAFELYKKANKIGNQEIKKHNLIGLGLCYDAKGNKEQAIQSIKKFICLSQESEDRRSEAVGYHYLGELYEESDPKLAEENYRKSIAIFAALHQELKNHSHWQITFFEEQAIPLLKLERLLLKQSKIEEALQVTDFRRSRALISALTGKFKFQKDDSLISSRLTVQEMQAFAHKMNTCFILYSFSFESTDNITAWVIPSQGEIICQQLSLGNLAEEVKEATQVFKTFPFIVEPTVAKRRPFLRPKKTRSSATYAFLDELTRGDIDESANSAVLQAFKKRLSLWYEALIAPLESYLPKDPQQVVTIIPDNFLAQIPFAAFLDKEEKYFIEKHPISIAPSIEILKLLDEIPKDFSESSLVIGNPTTPYPKEELEFAEKEAQTIVAAFLKTTPEKTLLQDNATVERAIDGMLDARWIHLACHGSIGANPEEKLDLHSVFEGLFKLAPDEIHPKGYLHAQEIAALTLHSELVFMS
uniref:CHAT domain-containing protein n=1 Tax=Candidatus Protochlamydia sp. W-9 TaxID=1785087 RepID=UPI00096A5787